MAQILDSTQVLSKIAPSDELDTYATHINNYGEGGVKIVKTTKERDAITPARINAGDIVIVTDGTTCDIYRLTAKTKVGDSYTYSWTAGLPGDQIISPSGKTLDDVVASVTWEEK